MKIDSYSENEDIFMDIILTKEEIRLLQDYAVLSLPLEINGKKVLDIGIKLAMTRAEEQENVIPFP